MLEVLSPRLGADPHADHYSEREVMRCVKCGGCMVLRQFYDFFETCYAWRCINCGLIVDKVIAQNRQASLMKQPGRRAQTGDTLNKEVEG